MTQVAHPELPPNPLQAQLDELGWKGFQAKVKAGEVPSLTNQFLQNYTFASVKEACDKIREDELIEVNVPKLDAKGAVIVTNGYVEHEKRMVYKRAHARKQLLQDRGVTEKQMIAWERAQEI